MTAEHVSYGKINSVNPLALIIDTIHWYLEESNRNKYLTLVPTDKSKDTLTKYEELLSEIRYLVRSITNISDNYDEKYMKIKLNSDDDLALKKRLKLCNMITVVRSVFHEGNKHYPQVFLDEFWYKL